MEFTHTDTDTENRVRQSKNTTEKMTRRDREGCRQLWSRIK